MLWPNKSKSFETCIVFCSVEKERKNQILTLGDDMIIFGYDYHDDDDDDDDRRGHVIQKIFLQ